MSVPLNHDGDGPCLTGPAASALAHRRRRLVLAELLEAGEPLRVDHLAREIRASRRNAPGGPPSGRDIESSLHHTHLPALKAAGLVHRPTPDHVASTDHPLFDHDAIEPVTLRDEDRPWDAMDALVSRPHRLHVVACLSERSEWYIDDLSDAVRHRMDPRRLDDVPGGDVRNVLHHVDLPRLADVDLLSYQEATGEVERETLPDLELLPDRYVS